MNSRVFRPVPTGEAAPKEKPPTDGNALWRLQDWDLGLSSASMDKVRQFHRELLKFNLRVNLVSRNTERDADEVHFYDCVRAVQLIQGSGRLTETVFDIGSGNGLPGIVLAVLEPSRRVFMVESDSRKAEFIKHILHTLDIQNGEVVLSRLESLKDVGIQCAVSRGFGTISKTLLGCNRLFRADGAYFHLKGPSWSREIAEIPSQVIVSWKPELVGEYTLPVSQARRAVVLTLKKA